MAAVQRARDASLAEALAAAGKDHGAVLIAGAGHVRKDRGVPAWLAALAPGKRVASLAWREVMAGASDPATMELPFDMVWFTPRVDDRDPCEGIEQKLERRPAKD
jgi:uncharacterized iron-regulated protein